MWPAVRTASLYGAGFALLHMAYGAVSGSNFLVFLGACGLVLSYGLAQRSDSVRLGSIMLLTLYVLMRVILGVFAWRDAGQTVLLSNLLAILLALYLLLALARLGPAFASKRDIGLGALVTKYLPLLPYLFFALFPLYFMMVTSLKTDAELYDLKGAPFWVTRAGFTMSNYQYLFDKTLYATWLWNSLKVSALATAVSVTLSILAAYALARLRFRGAETFGVAVFVTYLVPPSLLFLPLAKVVEMLDLTDRSLALIATYPTFLIPFCTWLLMGYFRTIPKEIEECAMIDGCNRIQALLRIVLPMAVPGIICAILFAFTISWNEFLYSLVFISTSTAKTMTVGVVSELIRGDIYYWGQLMAGAVVGSIPIVIAYVFFMDYYVSGLTAGAIK
jgi:multiple sugar transport system permease protein